MELFDFLNFYLDKFTSSPWITVLDIAIVTFVIYFALSQLRGTRAEQVLRGIALFALILILINLVPGFNAVQRLVNNALPALFIAIPVIFQDELRRFFAQIGEAGGVLRYFRDEEEQDATIDAILDACRRLSTRRHGALLVIERRTGLQEYIDTGVLIDAEVTSPLLLAIFHKDAELHDGGVIVRNGRVAAASCVMPLSNSRMSDRQMGLRHRAALGTSEVSDAVIVVVSEETGQIAVAHKGRILPRQSLQQLPELLRSFFTRESPEVETQ